MLRKVLKNSVWTGIGAVGNTLLSLAFAGLTIRWLGLEDAGFALLVQAVAGMNAAITGLGFYTAGIRYISEAHGQGDKVESRRVVQTLLACALILNIVLSALVFLLAPLLAQWSSYQGDISVIRTFVGLTAASAVLQGITLSLKSPLEALQRYDILSKRDLVFGTTYGVLCLTVLRFYPSLITLGLMQLLFALANVALFGTVFVHLMGYLPRPVIDWAMARKLWAYGRWSYVNSLGNLLLDNMDRVLVSGFFSAAALPIYSMAKRGFMIGHGLIAQQSVYLFPMFSALTEGKREKALVVEPKLRWFVTALSVGFYSAMVLAGPPMLDMLVGHDFGSRAEPLIVLFALTGLIEAQSIVPWKLALAFDKPALTTLYKYLCSTLVFGLMLLVGYLKLPIEFTAAAHLSYALPLLLLYRGIWKELEPGETVMGRFIKPLLSPASALPLVAVCWFFIVSRDMGPVARMGTALPVLLLLIPWITRFERGIGEPSQGVATLRRASEMALQRLPLLRVPLGRLTKLMIS